MKIVLCLFAILLLQTEVDAKTLLSRDIEEVGALLKRRKLQLIETKEEISSIKDKIEASRIDQKNQEAEFTSRLGKILLPLLHWPSVSFQREQNSWIMRDHMKFALMEMKSRLVHEPVVLMSESDAAIHEFTSYRESLDLKLKEMLAHEEVLALQLEELKLLQKKRNKGR